MIIKVVFFVTCCIYVVKLGDASMSSEVKNIYEKFGQNEYKVQFERGDVSYVNKTLIEVSTTSFAYNRIIKASNLTFMVYDDYNKNDLKVEFQAYKFLSNEYRLFAIHFQMDLCKFLEENIGGTRSGFQCGNVTSCPFTKNIRYFSCNNMVDETRYPPLIPSGRYKIELKVFAKTNTLFIANTYIRIYRILKPGQSGRD